VSGSERRFHDQRGGEEGKLGPRHNTTIDNEHVLGRNVYVKVLGQITDRLKALQHVRGARFSALAVRPPPVRVGIAVAADAVVVDAVVFVVASHHHRQSKWLAVPSS
jgi:hypothetical protein